MERKQFKKKRDCFEEAFKDSHEAYSAILSGRKPKYKVRWLVATRGKLLSATKADSIRTIEYPDFWFILLTFRFTLFLNDLWTLNKYNSGSGIGHSWFNCGSEKLLSFMTKGTM